MATVSLVTGFGASVGADADDPRLGGLVGELPRASDRFRRLWAPAGRDTVDGR
ncbi:MmyB family transcriptional regulator [Streptomyces sp. SudanB182_2057]|uniref:MmyB family transcriptional regulator n=1 Tax=Streptomyces sp. SudanB182_2057 TaxID=3035281 RepID=UPI003F54A3E4